ncbi:hypothetical protein ACOACO_08265 [Nocardioides sp. CPCC 205120]|uniref:hypothetical protein n=1 Tax=Nocardioides sp. CPCC 205120 TaxID=3406462 RepID=UPI003B511368
MATPRITPATLGAWLIKTDPRANPDLVAAVRDAVPLVVTRRCVSDNYRGRMMAPGDRVLLWVSGDGRLVTRGIWGLGHVSAALRPRDGDGRPEVGLDLPLSPGGVPAEAVRAAGAGDLEVLRMPAGSNPSWVSRDQLAALAPLLPPWPARSPDTTAPGA